MPRRRWNLLFLALILLYTITFRLCVINSPFGLGSEGYTSFYGVLARNYLNCNWQDTWGIPIITVGHIPEAPKVCYPSHPPLVPLLIAPCYYFFGFGDWQTRLPTSIAAVAAVLLIFLLLNRFSTRRIALLGSALYAAAPMTLYLSGSPEVVAMPLVFFVLLVIYAYLNFQSQPGGKTFFLLAGTFFLAAIADWPAFLIVPVLLVHFMAKSPRHRWPWIIIFGLWAAFCFFLLYFYIMLAAGDDWNWMFEKFRNRSLISAAAPPILAEWLPKAIEYNRSQHTLPLLFAAFLWVIAFSWRGRPSQPGAAVALIMLAWGGLHVLLGYEGVFLHDWWWAPLTPGLAVSGALLIEWLICALEERGISKTAHYGTVLAIALFAAWTAMNVFAEFNPANSDNALFKELGKAVQIAAPNPNDVVLVSWEGAEPQLWFYGNRPLRINVSSLDNFAGRLRDDSVDLPYGVTQPWKKKAAGMVLIDQICSKNPNWQNLEELRTHLQKTYASVTPPAALVGKFEIYDLRHRID